MPKVILLTGGARSGKSTHALRLASQYPRKGYVATAEPIDDEMRERIARHREERDQTFVTVEEPFDLARAIASLHNRVDVAIVDCLTVWLGNLMLRPGETGGRYPEIEAFLDVAAAPSFDLIFVTNEVGLGIVPADALSRRYRDLLGSVNQRIAKLADEVILMVCGIPVPVKTASPPRPD